MLILSGISADELAEDENTELNKLSPKEHVMHYVKLGMPKMDAVKAAAKDRKIPKSEMYKLALD